MRVAAVGDTELVNYSNIARESGMEVDFVLGQARVAIEAKGKAKITRNDFKHLLQFKREFPKVKKLIVVSLEPVARLTAEGILILPYREFLTRLWQGKIMD